MFVAGEMLDWEAPTGGYLLQAASRPVPLPGAAPCYGSIARLRIDFADALAMSPRPAAWSVGRCWSS